MRKFLFFMLSALISVQAMAQTITVKGRVTDARDGEGLPGATVKVEGAAGGEALLPTLTVTSPLTARQKQNWFSR